MNFLKTLLSFNNVTKILFFFVMFCVFNVDRSYAGYNVSDIRVGQGVGNIRIVFDSDKNFEYETFLLDNPKRLVIDIKDASVDPSIEDKKNESDLVDKIKIGSFDSGKTRVVFSLKKPILVKKVFFLPPQSTFDWRFVVDVSPVSSKQFSGNIGNDTLFSSSDSIFDFLGGSDDSEASKKKPSSNSNSKKKIIVLDAGHGGKDPGAIGYSGVYEKNITLAMAKEIKEILDRDSKYKVYLTRSNDVFISLRDRVAIARKYDADLFLSIHADSAKNRSAVGLSVYTLSENASDKEAEALADRENKADIIMGLNLVEHSKEVSDILINLAQRETMNRSSEFAGFMVEEMRKSVNLVSNTHRFAGFAVLKAPDVPSVLLELGYLSNRREEGLLKQKSYRSKLALSTKKSIDKYFSKID